jgi:hypothetical protein
MKDATTLSQEDRGNLDVPSSRVVETVKRGAFVGGSIGVGAGLILSIVGAVVRGPIPAAGVIAIFGAVLLGLAGAFAGAFFGAIVSGAYIGVRAFFQHS